MKKLIDLLAVLLILFQGQSFMPSSLAQSHIVSRTVLDETLKGASLDRESNLRKVDEFFSSPQISAVLEQFHLLGLERITQAVPTISDSDLARLADQVEDIDNRIEAGALTNEQLTYIVIALATAVIVLIIVHD